jgi:hypothetical protein
MTYEVTNNTPILYYYNIGVYRYYVNDRILNGRLRREM